MGRVQLSDNFRATVGSEEYTYQASTDRQAWYLAYEWSKGELLDALEEIDSSGNVIRQLLSEEDW